MTRPILALAGLLLYATGLLSNSFAAQETYTKDEYDTFSKNLFRGCMDKQVGNPLNSILLPSVIEESCKCAAERMTADLFGQIDIQLAMSRRDGEALIRALSNAEKSGAVTRTLMTCRQEAADRRGGQNGLFREGYSPSISKKIGLEGESRRSFVATGIQHCKEAQSRKTENNGVSDKVLQNYCSCSIDYMADRISETHLVGILQEEDSAKKFQETLTKSASNYCRKKLRPGSGALPNTSPNLGAKSAERQEPFPSSNDCEARAFTKDGKPLAGAAKTAFITKCEKDATAKK